MLRPILFFCFLSLCYSLAGQQRKPMINPYADHRVVHFGFSAGVHTQTLLFQHTAPSDGQTEQWLAEIPSISPGFNVGLIGSIATGQYVNFRFIPTLYFGSKQVWFREWERGEVVKQDVRSNYLSLPIQVKYSAMRLNNLRPYLIAGVSANIDLSRKLNEPLLLKRFWMGVELGVGSNFYFPFFRFCPELKFCLGLTNLLQTDRSDLTDLELLRYTNLLSRVTSRMFVLSLNFE